MDCVLNGCQKIPNLFVFRGPLLHKKPLGKSYGNLDSTNEEELRIRAKQSASTQQPNWGGQQPPLSVKVFCKYSNRSNLDLYNVLSESSLRYAE